MSSNLFDVIKMKDFFKEYICWLIIVFITPFVIPYIWFTHGEFIPIDEIDKGSLFSFYGGFLAFYGTFFLGMVAIWQNKQANEQNKRMLNIENSRHSCNIVLENSDSTLKHIRLSNEKDVYDNQQRDMRFTIINHGDAILKNIKIIFPDGIIFFSHIILAKGDKKNVVIAIPKDLNCQEKTELFFTSCNNVITFGNVKILLIGENLAEIKHYHFYGLQ